MSPALSSVDENLTLLRNLNKAGISLGVYRRVSKVSLTAVPTFEVLLRSFGKQLSSLVQSC